MYQNKIVTLGILLEILFMSLSCNNHRENNYERIVSGLKVENYRCDIGEAQTRISNQYNFFFSLINITNRDVIIDSIETSCSCLHVDYSPTVIKGHHNDSIVGRIDLEDIMGNFSRSIYVCLSDGEVMLLRVTGMAK